MVEPIEVPFVDSGLDEIFAKVSEGFKSAFSSSATEANQFAEILSKAFSGNITGLVSMWSPLAGAITQGTQALGEFVEKQEAAINRMSSLAQELGTSVAGLQGLQEAFAAGGVSVEGFDRFVQRMSLNVGRSWAEIQRQVQESAREQEHSINAVQEAALNLQKAYQGLDDANLQMTKAQNENAHVAQENANSIEAAELRVAEAHLNAEKHAAGPGAAKNFRDADQRIQAERDSLEMKQASLALEEAQEKAIERQLAAQQGLAKAGTALEQAQLNITKARVEQADLDEKAKQIDQKDPTKIAGALEGVMGGEGAKGLDLAAVSGKKFAEAIQLMASEGGKAATPLQTMMKTAEVFSKDTEGLISNTQRLAIVAAEGGGSMRGFGGDLQNVVNVFGQGPEKLKAFMDAAKQSSDALTNEEVAAIKETTAKMSELNSQLDESTKKLGALIGIDTSQFWEQIKQGAIDTVRQLTELIQWLDNLEKKVHEWGKPIREALGIKDSDSGNSNPPATGDSHNSQSNWGTPGGSDDKFYRDPDYMREHPYTGGRTRDDDEEQPGGWTGGLMRIRQGVGSFWNDLPRFAAGGSWDQSDSAGGWTDADGQRLGGIYTPHSDLDDKETGDYAGGGGGPQFVTLNVWGKQKTFTVGSAGNDDVSMLLPFQFGPNADDPHNRQEYWRTVGRQKKQKEDKPNYTNPYEDVDGGGSSGPPPSYASMHPDQWVTPGATGGLLRGPGTGTSDSIPARLSDGEFVVRAAAVQNYGVSLFHALNNMAVKGFAAGGGVGRSSSTAAIGSISTSGPSSIVNLSIDGNHFNGLRAPEAVASKLRNYAVHRDMTSTGKKPTWYK